MRSPERTARLSLPLLGAAAGAVSLGLLGCVAGLVIGLQVYAPTAWAAMFEIGIPAALLGAIVGLAAGALRSSFSGAVDFSDDQE